MPCRYVNDDAMQGDDSAVVYSRHEEAASVVDDEPLVVETACVT